MRERSNTLSPPPRTGTEDPGAHELGRTMAPSSAASSSDSEDHFSDAQSGPPSSKGVAPSSPVPRTRVEKVSDEPSYGEVPGTAAYDQRAEDAKPDEIAVMSPPPSLEPLDTSVGTASNHRRTPSAPPSPVPKTVVEEAPDSPGYRPQGAKKSHALDAPPDLILPASPDRDDKEDRRGDGASGGSSGLELDISGSDGPISPSLRSPAWPRARRKSSSAANRGGAVLSPGLQSESGFGDGDEFDDFADGQGDDDEFGDFGDFNDGAFDDEVEDEEDQPRAVPQPVPSVVPLPFDVPDLSSASTHEVLAAIDPLMDILFPASLRSTGSRHGSSSTSARDPNAIFQTPRSASLWAQLVAPPPLQPPDWIRSRIRRLFLVSLGVPVDLDEILPASSKQKKLILPSLRRVGSSGSVRSASLDSRSASRHRHGGRGTKEGLTTGGDGGGEGGPNDPSTASFDSQGRPVSTDASGVGKKKSGGANGGGGSSSRKPHEPRLDLVWARQLCATTDAALDGFTDAELRAHWDKLRELEGIAGEVLEYWQKRTDEKVSERETFEGVIENLVKHARKVRK